MNTILGHYQTTGEKLSAQVFILFILFYFYFILSNTILGHYQTTGEKLSAQVFILFYFIFYFLFYFIEV